MFGSKSVVDLLVRGGKIDIAVALDSDIAVNSAFGFRYLLADSAQGASSPIMGVLEVSPTAVSQPDASGGAAEELRRETRREHRPSSRWA